MSHALPVIPTTNSCWQRIGVWGDRSCPELANVTHCHNCDVFAAAGRRFLDTIAPGDYLEEWTARLSALPDDSVGDERSVLVFRLADEWLALSTNVLVEVTTPRIVHRIPHRGGLLSGLVNIRGELNLAVRLDLLLGIGAMNRDDGDGNARLIVIKKDSESWAFAADEVDRVRRIPSLSLVPPPPTLSRAVARLTEGVFSSKGRAVGLLDEVRLFAAMRERTR